MQFFSFAMSNIILSYHILYVRNIEPIKKQAGKEDKIYYNISCTDCCSIDSELTSLNYNT